MAGYGKLLSRIWSDPEFTGLSAQAQQVYCMLISHPTRNYAGVLPLTLRRWVKSTADATVESVKAALTELSRARFVVIDTDTEELLIRTYVRNDQVWKQPNLMKTALKLIKQTESVTLRATQKSELETILSLYPKTDISKDMLATYELTKTLVSELPEPFGDPFPEPFGDPFDEPIPKGSGVGVRKSLGYAPTPTPAPSPNTPTAPIAEPIDQPAPTDPHPPSDGRGKALARLQAANATARSPDAYRIAEAFSASLPVPIEPQLLAGIATQIDKCIRRGIPPPAIAAGLHAWTGSDSWSPTQIPNFVHKANNGHACQPPQGAELKTAQYQALKAQFTENPP